VPLFREGFHDRDHPHRACRSGTRGLPSSSFGPGSGNNGLINDHSSSDTIHGRDCLLLNETNEQASRRSHDQQLL
jgi:hypothetical protein